MKYASIAMEFQKQLLIEQGFKKGRFEIALEIKKAMGIEKAVAISGFSKQELKKESFTPESH